MFVVVRRYTFYHIIVIHSSSSSPSPITLRLALLFQGNILYTNLTITLLDTSSRLRTEDNSLLVPSTVVELSEDEGVVGVFEFEDSDVISSLTEENIELIIFSPFHTFLD